MKNLAGTNNDFDPQASRALISAVVTLAVEDLQLPEDNPNRVSAERFIFGDWSAGCDRCLQALDIDPQRFRNGLRERQAA